MTKDDPYVYYIVRDEVRKFRRFGASEVGNYK